MLNRFLAAAALIASIGVISPPAAGATSVPAKSATLSAPCTSAVQSVDRKCKWKWYHNHFCKYCWWHGHWELQWCRDDNWEHGSPG